MDDQKYLEKLESKLVLEDFLNIVDKQIKAQMQPVNSQLEQVNLKLIQAKSKLQSLQTQPRSAWIAPVGTGKLFN